MESDITVRGGSDHRRLFTNRKHWKVTFDVSLHSVSKMCCLRQTFQRKPILHNGWMQHQNACGQTLSDIINIINITDFYSIYKIVLAVSIVLWLLRLLEHIRVWLIDYQKHDTKPEIKPGRSVWQICCLSLVRTWRDTFKPFILAQSYLRTQSWLHNMTMMPFNFAYMNILAIMRKKT